MTKLPEPRKPVDRITVASLIALFLVIVLCWMLDRASLVKKAEEANKLLIQNSSNEPRKNIQELSPLSIPAPIPSDKIIVKPNTPQTSSEVPTSSNSQARDQRGMLTAIEDYNIWSLEHRKVALQFQLLKDNILFVIVLAIVSFGLYLAYTQFEKGGQHEGSLKLGPAGVEVTSSILGIFILAFSMGFLYLYLVHVFPLQELEQDNPIPVSEPINSNPEASPNTQSKE